MPTCEQDLQWRESGLVCVRRRKSGDAVYMRILCLQHESRLVVYSAGTLRHECTYKALNKRTDTDFDHVGQVLLLVHA